MLYGDGAGRLTRRERLLAGGRPWAIVAGNFDADGRPDLAVVDLAGGSMTLVRHG